MQQLADAYRKTEKVPDDDKEALTRLAAKVFSGTVAKLPKPLREHMGGMRASMPEPGQDYEFSFTEQTTDFYNPDNTFSLEEAAELIPSFPEINDYFGGDAKAIISQEMSARLRRQGKLTLRDIHACAIVAGLKRAQPAKLNLIALEGNPGIGKTTAVRQYLSSQASGGQLVPETGRRGQSAAQAHRGGRRGRWLAQPRHAQWINPGHHTRARAGGGR